MILSLRASLPATTPNLFIKAALVIPQRRHTALALLAILIPATSFGWGRDGHRIIGHIAEQFLTPNARAAVRDLLGDASLAEVSTWADEVRGTPAYRWTAPMHYVNSPPGSDGYDQQRDCADGCCVVGAIEHYADVLRDRQAPRPDRIEALKMLVHFVGDVHQPLHAGYGVDRGGNDVKVFFFGDNTNLHSLWDSGLIRRTQKNWSEYAAELHKRESSKRRTAVNLDPAVWAAESFKLAEGNAYAIPGDGELGQDYFEKNIPVVEQQLAIAGVRLAEMLNAIFDEDQEHMPQVDSQ